MEGQLGTTVLLESSRSANALFGVSSAVAVDLSRTRSVVTLESLRALGAEASLSSSFTASIGSETSRATAVDIAISLQAGSVDVSLAASVLSIATFASASVFAERIRAVAAEADIQALAAGASNAAGAVGSSLAASISTTGSIVASLSSGIARELVRASGIEASLAFGISTSGKFCPLALSDCRQHGDCLAGLRLVARRAHRGVAGRVQRRH